jgi:deazaflavin-dependent oxidoreductase (nitroreductase family)
VTPKPSAFQKLLHHIVMTRPVTAFFAPRVHRIDQAILKLTNERRSGSELLGWPIIQLRTAGAKTKQPRTIPLIGMPDGERFILIASNFGRKKTPGWYYNLKAHPECEVQFNGRQGRYIAREAEGDEFDKYWQLALSYYAGYQKYRERAVHRHIPVMLLEPKK